MPVLVLKCDFFFDYSLLLWSFQFIEINTVFICPLLFVQDVPYLDVAPYMPEYYKPQNLLDFEERLPSSDSLSLHSFTSLTSTNLEWDDSAIAPSSEGKSQEPPPPSPHLHFCSSSFVINSFIYLPFVFHSHSVFHISAGHTHIRTAQFWECES